MSFLFLASTVFGLLEPIEAPLQSLLEWIHESLGVTWAWSIVILTCIVRIAMKCSGVVKRRKSASPSLGGRPIAEAKISSNVENGRVDTVVPASIMRRASRLATSCAWRNDIDSVRTSESASSASVMPLSSM